MAMAARRRSDGAIHVLLPEVQRGGYGMEVGTTLISTAWKEPPSVVVNSCGGHVMPTLSADEYKMTQAQKDHRGGTSCIQLRAVRESSVGGSGCALRKEVP